MKTMKIIGLFLLVQLFSAASAFGQKASVVINQTNNAVAFTEDGNLWGLRIGGKQELPPNFKSIEYKHGIYILCDMENNWGIADDQVNILLDQEWFKCAGVKVSEGFVIFQKVDGGKDVIYDRKTWKITAAQTITYDDMYKEMQQHYADKAGTPVLNYETAAERSRRIWNTQPRVESKNGKKVLMFQDIELGTGEEIVSLNTDYDSDGRWYFRVKMNGKNGVVFVKKENPNKPFTSISFKYTKIESANNGWQMLNCYLLDGTVDLLWYDGSTTAQKSIPTVQK